MSEQFQQLRKERNLTIPEIVLKCSLSIEHIEQIEQGKAVGFARYKTLAHYYGKQIKIVLE